MGGCRQFSSGVVLCKYPTVVFITDFSVRHGGGITQKYVLAKVVADDSPVETSQCQVAVDYRKGAVLYLLQQVILTVGLVDFRHTVYLVDGSHVEIRTESFVGQCQDIGFSGLGFDAEVKVSGIVPAAYVHSGNHFTRFELGQALFLVVAVDMIVCRCHLGIVHVAAVVPYAVFFVDAHVAHLYGKEVFQYGLPYATGIYVIVDAEDGRHGGIVFNLIKPRFLYICEVYFQIVIPQEFTPVGRSDVLDNLFAVGINADDLCRFLSVVTYIHFDDGFLVLSGMITYL